MSGGALEYNQYRIRETADKIKEYFLIYRDRRLQAAYIGMDGRRREERRKCRPETLRILRDAYRILSEAAIYAERIDFWLSGDDGEENLREQLAEELAECRQEKLTLRRAAPAPDEEPEDDTYCEVAEGVWASKTKGTSTDVLEKLRMGYREPRKGNRSRRCENCLSYSNWRCDLMLGFVSQNGVCGYWTDPDSSLCRTCEHAGEFDGRMTRCKLPERGTCFTQQCPTYVRSETAKGNSTRAKVNRNAV